MPSVQYGDKIAVWFSCGAASAVAAKMTLDQYGDRCSVRVLNNPVMEEDEDNRRFLADVRE
jgi:PP-loop superfamily ATP-utilizing enzyme